MIRLLITEIPSISADEYETEQSRLDERTRMRLVVAKENVRRSTLAGRILLRRGVQELFGRREYSITYTENGKPQLDFCFFSISHSGDRAVCVISDKPIGADIERIRDIKKREHYPFFTVREAAEINSSPDLSLRFTELWTRKEAYIKLCGGRMDTDGTVDTAMLQNAEFVTKITDGYVISVCQYSTLPSDLGE